MSRFGNARFVEPMRKYKGYAFRFEFTSYKVFWKSGKAIDTHKLGNLKEAKSFITLLAKVTSSDLLKDIFKCHTCGAIAECKNNKCDKCKS